MKFALATLATVTSVVVSAMPTFEGMPNQDLSYCSNKPGPDIKSIIHER